MAFLACTCSIFQIGLAAVPVFEAAVPFRVTPCDQTCPVHLKLDLDIAFVPVVETIIEEGERSNGDWAITYDVKYRYTTSIHRDHDLRNEKMCT